ncbi:hypothetical protein HII31_10235 [Pseudocercospora fuligena]|uniref:F-box domain-containing protein n=1 Tax=Pseudocercospora fuligena TaxID=685502 RepID=A0A8H6RCN4_9PEZI|nr:hypothetical protein HII31_10235 [Pseudocercospora fuligena]
MAATLTSVPTELLQDIASRIPRHDLLHLRKVNREVAAKVDDVFVERFFTSRRHLVTKYSLEKLAEMTAVPRLNRKMKKLELVVTGISEYEWDKPVPLPPKTKKEAYYTGDWGLPGAKPKTNSERLMEYLEALREWTAQKLIYESWYAECDILSNEVDVAMLSATFINFKSSSIILDTVKGTHDYSNAFGLQHLSNKLGVYRSKKTYGSFFCHFKNHNIATLIVRSLAHAVYPVFDLSLGCEVTGCFYRDLGLNSADLGKPQMSFATLQQLELGINWFENGHEPDEKGLQCLKQLLGAAPLLRKLRFCVDQEDFGEDQPLPARVLHAFAGNKLESIDLFGGKYRHQDMCQFLQHHRTTLTELDLVEVDMLRTDDWRLVCKQLAKHDRLQRLSVMGVSHKNRFMCTFRAVQGTEAIQSWTTKIAQSTRFKSPDEELYGTDSDSDS